MYSDSSKPFIGDVQEQPATAARWCAHVRRTWYVCSLPEYRNGKQHGDFGYSEKASDAIALSTYWQRRFRAQVRHCSQHDSVSFVPVSQRL